jgi:hypothetical protein
VNQIEPSDRKLIYQALTMYANWLETLNPVLSANDMLNRGQGNKIQPTNPDKRELVNRLRILSSEIIKDLPHA